MELSSHEADIAIPLNATYGGGGGGNGGGHGHAHLIHHDHHNHIINPSSTHPQIPSTTNGQSSIPPSSGIDHHNHHHHDNHAPTATTTTTNSNNSFKKMVRYRECLKNHAAAMGGTATDGCGEFMPSGEDGTIEALTCSACSCHRNFHRQEIEGETNNSSSSCECLPHFKRKLFLGHHKAILGPESLGYPTSGGPTMIPSRATPQSMIMSYQQPSDHSDEQDGGDGVMMMGRPHHHHHHHPQLMMKKRFRTKFTQEQKEKMFNFAEKVGWKIQKQEEAVVQQFCQEIGVKRRVLKVWMHNNKHNLAKKNPSTTTTTTTS